MFKSIRILDRVLRGEMTQASAMQKGFVEIPVWGTLGVIVVLAMFHGACMGGFALFKPEGPTPAQMLASTVKTPLLFLLTLFVTFPSLYVFNALLGSRLKILPLLRLLVASLGVMVAVLASLGPIVAFFSVSSTSYAFMILLNVAVFALAGFLGIGFLLQTLHRLSIPSQPKTPEVIPEVIDPNAPQETPGPLEPTENQVVSRPVLTVFWCWMVLFGLVGAQMSWVLRPFIGNPNQPFQWFRTREANFFEAVYHTLVNFLGQGGA